MTTRRGFLAGLALAPFAVLFGKSAPAEPFPRHHVLVVGDPVPIGEVAWSNPDDGESWNTLDSYYLAS